MDLLLGLFIGIGLSAACGFRVFVPLLGMSIASQSGHLTLASGFEWIGTWPAMFAFGSATVLEIGAFYVPWIDNLMDTIATPAALVAGTMVTASQLGDASPFLKWSLAVIAGGGVCGLIQSGTVITRAASSGSTGGLGNFAVSTVELVSSITMTFLVLVLPMIAMAVLFCLLVWTVILIVRWKFRAPSVADPHSNQVASM
ncbi:DUF4126 domain-containing protein [Schlesneria paludicola]|uniref:DUF4126 domain-containing protein n=1 Tax=Schlesneria paludicola TaxID=360056 RepID=UPI00029A426C|nr:DUF4126 domain-containing protein [Schlesneria paludicola]